MKGNHTDQQLISPFINLIKNMVKGFECKWAACIKNPPSLVFSLWLKDETVYLLSADEEFRNGHALYQDNGSVCEVALDVPDFYETASCIKKAGEFQLYVDINGNVKVDIDGTILTRQNDPTIINLIYSIAEHIK